MSKNKIWAVLDVSEEAKDEAKKRAKLEKKNIGIWLSDYILGKGNDNSIEKMEHKDFLAVADNISLQMNEIKLGMKAIYNELSEIRHEIHPLPKKNFFSKFLG